MDATLYTVWRPKNIVIIIILTVLINAILFMGLPALTRIADRDRNTKIVSQYMLTARETPKPHEDPKEKKLRRKALKQIPTPKIPSASQRKLDAPKFAFDTGEGSIDGLAVSIMSTEGMDINMDDFAFSLKDVDTPPRAIRTPPVNYPFKAKSEGLEGRIFVRIRVGVDGKATNIKAKRAEPPEVLEDFREEAEKAVARYRFEPARLGGEAVPVWALQPIVFELF
jgi:protein TonB